MNAICKPLSFSVQKAHRTQLRLAKKIITEDKLQNRIHFVAGVDVAYESDVSIGAVAVLNFDSFELVESQTARCKTAFPYIPTLLSFREVPPSVLAVNKLQLKPDVFLVDGQGVAHPYGCGFASHLGITIKRPTIGVAKSILVGELERTKANEPIVPLKHKKRVIGAAVTTKPGTKPVYVSVGHMVSLGTAIQTVIRCARGNRVPEPLRRAHEIATTEKRKIQIQSTS